MARLRDIKQKFGLPVMKAIAVENAADLAPLPGYAAVADRILFDARAPKEATRPGGLGAVFDWHVLRTSRPRTAVHGLRRPRRRRMSLKPFASPAPAASMSPPGVERTPGVKDPDMIRAFIRAARATDRRV